MTSRRQCLLLGMGLLLVPGAVIAAPSAEEGKEPFIDRDGDGIRDGEEDRFRRRRRRGGGKNGSEQPRQRRKRDRRGKGNK